MNNKLGIRLKKTLFSEVAERFSKTPEDILHHSIMFQINHTLLEQGYHAFATEDQLRGVVARSVEVNTLEVCALRNCVINHHAGEGQINVEVAQYKFSPLSIDALSLQPATVPTDSAAPVWSIVGKSHVYLLNTLLIPLICNPVMQRRQCSVCFCPPAKKSNC